MDKLICYHQLLLIVIFMISTVSMVVTDERNHSIHATSNLLVHNDTTVYFPVVIRYVAILSLLDESFCF